MILTTAILTSCVKVLFVPAYKSTDFEVHRNWLAITHSLPRHSWYYENTSKWTLDYPPLFAWFEYLLSQLAYYFDPNMLLVNNVGYASDKTVLFQRLSVIFTDSLYVYGVSRICAILPKGWKKEVVLPILLLTNCGLLMVDHIHFQYNGMMYGVMLLSIADMFAENYLRSSFWFSVLLNMKHIYLYLAPAYFIYLLRHYCLPGSLSLKTVVRRDTMLNFLKLGSVVLSVFLMSFGPFVAHLPQVLSRLFPFKRGLCHAYWAPNVWALYNTADKAGAFLMGSPPASNASMTGGLVGEFPHVVLPSIGPTTTLVLTAGFVAPVMFKLFLLERRPIHFLRCLVLCALTSFLFGWHVHEKAILMAILPLSILSILEPRDASTFLLLAVTGHYALFPLLFPAALALVKGLLLVLHSAYTFYSLCKIHGRPLLNRIEYAYLAGLGVIFLYEQVGHRALGLDRRLPFLPLMLTSAYCALGVTYSWCRYYWRFLQMDRKSKRVKSQ